MAAFLRFGADLAQDPQAGAGDGREVVLSAFRLESVAAIAEKDEVALIEPAQELARLRDFFGGHRQLDGLELRDVGLETLAHRPPVRDGEADLREDRLDARAHGLELGGLGLLIDLDVHVRLDQRVGRRLDRDP